LTIDPLKIPIDLQIEEVERVDANNIKIKWSKGSNQPDSLLPLNFLAANCPSHDLQSNSKTFKSPKVILN
jgi:hypothetical protein